MSSRAARRRALTCALAAVLALAGTLLGIAPAGATYPTVVSGSSPIAYYRLGEAAGTTMSDSSGNGHDGTYAGGVTLGGAPAITVDTNTSAFFDGTGSGSASGITAPQTAYTLEAWIRPANVTQDGPARLVSISTSKTQRNVTLGQGMHGNQPADLCQQIHVVEFGRAAAATVEQREPELLMPVQSLAGVFAWRHDRNFIVREFHAERMFLEYRGIAPAAGPVELRNDRRRVLDADLPDAILVAVQGQQPAIGRERWGTQIAGPFRRR